MHICKQTVLPPHPQQSNLVGISVLDGGTRLSTMLGIPPSTSTAPTSIRFYGHAEGDGMGGLRKKNRQDQALTAQISLALGLLVPHQKHRGHAMQSAG